MGDNCLTGKLFKKFMGNEYFERLKNSMEVKQKRETTQREREKGLWRDLSYAGSLPQVLQC